MVNINRSSGLNNMPSITSTSRLATDRAKASVITSIASTQSATSAQSSFNGRYNPPTSAIFNIITQLLNILISAITAILKNYTPTPTPTPTRAIRP